MRVHISLQVKNLEKSRAFYSRLFDQPASKEKDDYINFRLDEPAIHLALSLGESAAKSGCEHFGIELPSAEEFRTWQSRLLEAAPELNAEPESGAKCCYAKADKVWLTDPDGHRWEIWHRTGDHSAR